MEVVITFTEEEWRIIRSRVCQLFPGDMSNAQANMIVSDFIAQHCSLSIKTLCGLFNFPVSTDTEKE